MCIAHIAVEWGLRTDTRFSQLGTHNWIFVNSLLIFLKAEVNICERDETVSATGKKRIGTRGCVTDSFAPDVSRSCTLRVFVVPKVQEERRYFL